MALYVIGSGPGIGVTTACTFASKGFNAIALFSRKGERLQDDAKTVLKTNPNARITTYAVDVANFADLTKALNEARKAVGDPEVVLFNAARIAPVEIGKEPVENLVHDFQIMNGGLYVAATWALPLLEAKAKEDPKSKPTFFMTGGYVWCDPLPEVFALCMQKAAQHNLMHSLWKQFGTSKRIHFATLSIGGVVQDSDKNINAKAIAGHYWDLYTEDQISWRFNVDLMPSEA